jgi:glycosyltransferase involved in cell wall biosynthesis
MKKIKISLISTTYQEEKTIKRFVESILGQSRVPDEIVIVDSMSKDNTANIIKSFRSRKIRLIQKKSNISQGRNLAIKNTKNPYVLLTDAGCILDKDWVKNMEKSFESGAEYVMGNFKPLSLNEKQRIMGWISLQTEKKLASDPYMASARSMGFKKYVWKKIGGFPEDLYTGEDTKFALAAKNLKFKAVFAKDSIVYWRPRDSLKKFIKQFYLYGFGDVKSKNVIKIWKRLAIFVAYTLGHVTMIFLLFLNPKIFLMLLLLYMLVLMILSIRWAFKKPINLARFFTIPFLIYMQRVSYVAGVFSGFFNYKKPAKVRKFD